MHVLVDALNCKPQQTGIRSYTVELARALSSRPDVRVSVLTTLPDAFSDLEKCEHLVHASPRSRNFAYRTLARGVILARAVRLASPDVVLINSPEAPIRAPGAPLAIVLHDVGPIVAPSLYGRLKWARFSVDLRRVLRRADHVLSVSEATATEAFLGAGLERERCTVIGSGPRRSHTVGKGCATSPDPFVLYVGTGAPNKNLMTLVRAFGRDYPRPAARLVIVGPLTASETTALRAEAARVGAADRVECRGFVAESELEAFYSSAVLFAFPSVHEGFGMPVVEAMARGLPTVCSSIPSLREAAGGAAVEVAHALDPEDWNAAIRDVLGDEELRDRLRTAGLQRALGLDWSDVASRAVVALKRTVEQAAGPRVPPSV